MPTSDHCTITLMGTGTSTGVPMIGCDCDVCTSDDPRNHRTRTGVLVSAPEGKLIIDAPPELRLQLIRERVDLIQAAVFTHAHADHVMGLDDLRLCGFRMGRPVPLFCEATVEETIRRSFFYAFSDLTPAHPWALPRFEFHRIEPGHQFELLGASILPFRLYHGDLPMLGFRVGNVAFCTDVNRIPEETLPFLENLDVLILDCVRKKPHATHFSLPESLEIIDQLQPRRAYLTHLSHDFDYAQTNAHLPPGVELAYDGLCVAL